MKQPKKLTLASIKIKSFSTSLSESETSLIKGGVISETLCDTNNLMICLTKVSGNPRCEETPDDDV